MKLHGGLFFLALMACAPERLDEPSAGVGLGELQTTPAGLFELSGKGAGSFASVTPVGSASLCGATKLNLVLGVNMGSDAARWLNDATTRSVALYVASTAQRVSLQGTASTLTYPPLDLSSSAPVFFTVTVTASAPAQCTQLSATAASAAQQQALGWAALTPTAREFQLKVAGNAAGSSGKLKVTAERKTAWGSNVKVEPSLSEAKALWSWVESITRDRHVVEEELVLTLSAGNRELIRVSANGPASATNGAVISLQLTNLVITASPNPDAGP